jgi:hypothetical protein
MSGESGVWKMEVFDNSDYFEWILYLTCMPLRLIISHFHSFLSYHDVLYNITNRNSVTILYSHNIAIILYI